MFDPSTTAYQLVPSGRTRTAIFSPTLKPGEKRKVDVKNIAAPFDELVVYGWITNEEFVEVFVFEDGKLRQFLGLR